MKEIEVKAKVRDEKLLMEKLAALNIALSKPISQRDRVYFPKGVSPADRPNEMALRLRDQDGKIIFTYKKPDRNNLDKVEYESVVGDAEAMAHICEALGFEELVKINKVRRKARYRDYEICVDEVEGLGAFVEIEKMSAEGDAGKIQDEIFEFMRSLGIAPEDRVYKGYDLLLLNI